MLAERIKKWPERWIEKGERLGIEKGERLHAEKTACNLIARTEMDDAMIAEIAGMPIEDVAQLRAESRH